MLIFVKYKYLICMLANEFDVIIIGGGITGAGTQRDCAMRGLRTLLIESSDIATGATGRNHGLLHSGARYAVNDVESAAECIKENLILRQIASHCIDESDGLFITLPEDDLGYQQNFVDSCRKAGIAAEIIDPDLAKRLEPAVNPDLIGAVRVPDCSVDPFRLCAANMLDAKLHGAQVRLQTEVVGLIMEADTVKGVHTRNLVTGEEQDYYAPVTVNAGGIWGQEIAQMAGVKVGMFPAKGALLIFAHRVNNMVINRCRKPSNADILVPGDTVCIIGTTSSRIPLEECRDVAVTPDEVTLLISEGIKLAPRLSSTRILRAYAGVRPLVSADDDPSGRNISRGIVCLDHESRDGVKGFVTITGGKLTTYRLMAEMATDLVCKKLGIEKACETATAPLPGSEEKSYEDVAKRIWENPSTAQKVAASRLGTRAARIRSTDKRDEALICECEEVSMGEINAAIDRLEVSTLTDLRRRTRVGMGTCQGEYCACRAAGLLAKAHGCIDKERADIANFLQERWKGNFPIGWGDTLREAEYTQWVYKHVLGI
ncbi:MAG: anaerobic glycerol-3-phosphate dehydrogenase subunit A [Bacteroidales bacterium]|nr:anaerobic glycerol-3-phosphate dehydrogenase subunit A [Bacteroidales bacterium]